jgi:hypothetical protein
VFRVSGTWIWHQARLKWPVSNSFFSADVCTLGGAKYAGVTAATDLEMTEEDSDSNGLIDLFEDALWDTDIWNLGVGYYPSHQWED